MESKRERLFDRGARALMKYGYDGTIYCCPICAKGFRRESLYNGELSLEHVPPKSVGGKEIVLTCKDCNSFAGSQYDHQFKAERELEAVKASFFTGTFSGGGKVKLRTGGITVNSVLEDNGTRLKFTTYRKRNSPVVADAFSAHIHKEGGPGQFDVIY